MFFHPGRHISLPMKKAGKTVSIKIGGSIFSIQSPVGDARVKQIESFINRKFEEIKVKNPRLTFSEVMTLTLLHIADEFIDAEERNIRLRNEVMGELKTLKHAVAEIREFIEEKVSSFEDEAG